MEAEAPRGRSSGWIWLILLILFALVLVALVGPLLNANVKTATQNSNESHCPPTGQAFNGLQEAFTLAQTAEQYRLKSPFKGIYGLASYIICFRDGSQQRNQSPVFKGYDSPTQPTNATHSEQPSYRWLQLQFSRLSVDLNTVTAIYATIFSQVAVCSVCKQDMISWQQTLRQKAGTDQVYLSIWDIARGKGFDPATYPAETGVSVTSDVLEQVSIPFGS